MDWKNLLKELKFWGFVVLIFLFLGLVFGQIAVWLFF